MPYLRTPTVERQIEGAIALSADALVARARITDVADSQFLQEETLAYLIRRAHRAADDDVVDGLAPALVVRCKRFLTTHFRTLRPEELEELVADVMAELSEQLVEPEGSDRGDFLQVRFWVVVKRLGLAAYRRAVEQSRRDSLLVVIDHTGAGAEEDEEEQSVELSNGLTPAPDTRLLTHEALARLETNVRQAFLLKLEGWPLKIVTPPCPPSVDTSEKHHARFATGWHRLRSNWRPGATRRQAHDAAARANWPRGRARGCAERVRRGTGRHR